MFLLCLNHRKNNSEMTGQKFPPSYRKKINFLGIHGDVLCAYLMCLPFSVLRWDCAGISKALLFHSSHALTT
jgi:hypothetical protein